MSDLRRLDFAFWQACAELRQHAEEPQWFSVAPDGEPVPVEAPTYCLAPGRCSCCGTLDWTDEELAAVFGSTQLGSAQTTPQPQTHPHSLTPPTLHESESTSTPCSQSPRSKTPRQD